MDPTGGEILWWKKHVVVGTRNTRKTSSNENSWAILRTDHGLLCIYLGWSSMGQGCLWLSSTGDEKLLQVTT
jgi:hypothetical protein